MSSATAPRPRPAANPARPARRQRSGVSREPPAAPAAARPPREPLAGGAAPSRRGGDTLPGVGQHGGAGGQAGPGQGRGHSAAQPPRPLRAGQGWGLFPAGPAALSGGLGTAGVAGPGCEIT